MRHLLIAFFALLVFASCSKDRVEDPSNDFQSLDNYRNKNLEPTQTFTITTDSGDPIIGKKGTTLYPNRADLQTASGADVDLPYDIHLIELYTVKDFIINIKATKSGTTVINSAGMVKVTGSKDGGALSLKAGTFFRTDLATSATETGMNVYQGTFPDYSFTNWNLASDGSSVGTNNGKYALSLGTLGWSNTGKSKATETVTVNYSINATGTEFIELYAVTADYTGLIIGSNLVISGIPKGQAVTLLALATDSDGEYRVFRQTTTLSSDTNIELELDVYSESEFENLLNGL